MDFPNPKRDSRNISKAKLKNFWEVWEQPLHLCWIIIAGRNLAACQKKAKEIGGTTVAVQCDVTNRLNIADFVLEKYKKLR